MYLDGSVRMEVLRVHITGYTASFRYPIFISGFQPSLPVPPLSTVYGFLSAAKGKIVIPDDTKIGYIFHSKGKFVDLETVYELEGYLTAKSNVCRREILADPEMYLYLTNTEFQTYLQKPCYPLLLGRSSDLCFIDEIKRIELKKVAGSIKVGKSIIPFDIEGVHGMLQALPVYFTDDVPRRTVGTRMFYLLDKFIEHTGDEFYYDEELDWGVYIHEY